MNSLWQLIFSIAIAVSVTACAPDYDEPRSAPQTVQEPTPSPTPEPQPDEPKESTINGMKAEDFYAQLFVKVTGNCRWNTVQYQYPRSNIVQISVFPIGNPVRANISLILSVDNNYRAIYREFTRVKLPDGTNVDLIKAEKVVSGAWKIESTTLLLDGLGKGEGLLSNGKPAIRIRFAKDIITSGIQNRTMLLETTLNPWAPFPEYNPCDL